MPLTLRPTGLSRDPNAKDQCIYEGGQETVGRIYEDKTAPGDGGRWAWFLQITGASRPPSAYLQHVAHTGKILAGFARATRLPCVVILADGGRFCIDDDPFQHDCVERICRTITNA